jgi:hypothetical protein
MFALVLALAQLSSCLECEDDAVMPVDLHDGEYRIVAPWNASRGAVLELRDDRMLIEYTNDSGERIRVTYDVVATGAATE